MKIWEAKVEQIFTKYENSTYLIKNINRCKDNIIPDYAKTAIGIYNIYFDKSSIFINIDDFKINEFENYLPDSTIVILEKIINMIKSKDREEKLNNIGI